MVLVKWKFIINSEKAEKVLNYELSAVSAFIGIIIPLILLSIEFMGKNPGYATNLLLKRTGIRRTLVFSFVLVILILVSLFNLNIKILTISPKGIFYWVFFSLEYFVILTVELVNHIFKVSEIISNRFLIKTLLNELLFQNEKIQKKEFFLYKKAELNWKYLAELDISYQIDNEYQGFIIIPSNKNGVISDFNLRRFKNFLN